MSDVLVLETQKIAEDKAAQLPRPSGYHILCTIPKMGDKFGNVILKSEETVKVEEQTTIVLFVIALGLDAYKDEKKFPSGAWCKEGDFIITRAYAGTRVKIHGHEFRIINDDTVEAVVDNPVGISLAGRSV